MLSAASQVRWVPIDEIVLPDGEWMDEAPNGAVTVTELPSGGCRLVCGSDTLRRRREAGQSCVDVIISAQDRMERRISKLLDQLVRGTLHYLDEAESYRILLHSSGWTAQQLAQRIGRTPSTLSRKLRLLDHSAEVRCALRESGLCERYAQLLLRVPGQQGRMRILRHVMEEGLSVKETEKRIDELLARMPVPVAGGRRMKPLMRDYRLYVNAIRGIVEQMEDAGLDGRMQVTVGRHVAEVRITIPIFHKNVR